MGDELPHDRIFVRDYATEVEIGAFHEEHGRRQRVRFDIAAEVARPPDPLDDDVDRILSYDRLTEAVEAELGAGRTNLLETMAERIARRILAAPQALAVHLRVEKIDRGPFVLGVEITRSRADAAVPAEVAPRPRVVHLTAPAVASDHLGGWLDRLAGQGAPVILTVPATAPVPPAASQEARRRIALLAVEQSAWALAARDRRIHVVGSRTELDWAMRNGRISVWAPSRMVIETPDDPAPDPGPDSGPDPGHAAQLSAWFADRMQAVELVVVGGRAPVAGCPTRSVPDAAQW